MCCRDAFRRARNFDFLHPNSKRLIQFVHLLLKVNLATAAAWFKPRPTLTWADCGGIMKVIHTRLAPPRRRRDRPRWTHRMHGDVTDRATVSARKIGIRMPRSALDQNTRLRVWKMRSKGNFIRYEST
jgi:hypothetical protein